MKARLLLGVLVVVTAVSLAGCTNDDPYGLKDLPAAPATAPSEADSATTSDTVAAATVGQPASTGTWLLLVEDASRAAAVGKLSADEGQQYLVLTLEITNGGVADENISPSNFTLVNEDGKALNPADVNDETFIQDPPSKVIAGRARKVYIAFDIPRGSGPYQLVFTPNADDETAQPAILSVD